MYIVLQVTGISLHYDPNHLQESKIQQTKITFIAIKFKHKTVEESLERNGIRYVFRRLKVTIRTPFPTFLCSHSAVETVLPSVVMFTVSECIYHVRSNRYMASLF
jgi:hypothetical protein